MLNYTGLYSLVAIGLALLTGIGGMTSFGQAAFVGVGAYATAYFTATVGLSPWIALLIGLAFTSCHGADAGRIDACDWRATIFRSARLRGD